MRRYAWPLVEDVERQHEQFVGEAVRPHAECVVPDARARVRVVWCAVPPARRVCVEACAGARCVAPRSAAGWSVVPLCAGRSAAELSAERP